MKAGWPLTLPSRWGGRLRRIAEGVAGGVLATGTGVTTRAGAESGSAGVVVLMLMRLASPPVCRLLVAVGAQARLVIGPARFDLDPDFQVHGAAEQFFHIQASLGGHFLQARALVSDDHGLVRIALDQDGGKYAAQIAFLLEFLDQHGAGVRQFIAD